MNYFKYSIYSAGDAIRFGFVIVFQIYEII